MKLNFPTTILLTAGLACHTYGGSVKTIFIIAMENHNWTQPSTQTSPGQVFGNAAAPYINSLVTGPGAFSNVPVGFTSSFNSPAIGQLIGVMIYVSAPSGSSADFSLVP